MIAPAPNKCSEVKMRLISIGDIHGQLEKLKTLLGIVRPTQNDKLVFLGDYIDRGPDSKGVVDCLIELSGQVPSIFLRGNHEQMMLDALACDAPDRLPGWKRLADICTLWAMETRHLKDSGMWLRNGAKTTMQSYGASQGKFPFQWDLIPQEHVDFLAKSVLWHRENGFLFVHAGALENKPLENQIETLLWGRYSPPGEQEIHVVGHEVTPDGRPYFEPGRYNLDTGAGLDGPLTACDVLTKEIWQTS